MKSDSEDVNHLEVLFKGFDMLAVAATFVAAIQSQLMAITLTTQTNEASIADRAVNAFHLGGFVIDLIAAFLAFFTSRWLQRLTIAEKNYLIAAFRRQAIKDGREKAKDSESVQDLEKQLDVDISQIPPLPNTVACAFFSMSLFVPMPLLIIGVFCMAAGFMVHVWSRHARVVSAIVTFAIVATMPFLLGVTMIGRNEKRRKAIIRRLSAMQGDW